MSTVFASDLDRTLIHPFRDLERGERERALVVEQLDGQPLTVSDRDSFTRLLGSSLVELVPATTRSRRQLERIDMLSSVVDQGWAICANGAIVLRCGQPVREWADAVAARQREAASIDEIRELLLGLLGPPGEGNRLRRWRHCDAHFLYAVCARGVVPDSLGVELHGELASRGWCATVHSHKLYVMPQSLTKHAALEFVLERLGQSLGFAAGDSQLDAGMLLLAAEAWVPSGAEVLADVEASEQVRITESLHIGAVREIVSAVLGAASLAA